MDATNNLKGLEMILDFSKAKAAKKLTKIDDVIAKKLAYLRTSRGLTPEQLSKNVGVCPEQIRKYEEGINRITAGRLKVIVNELGLSIACFFENDFDLPKRSPTRLCLEMQRNFLRIKDGGVQSAVSSLIAALAAKESI